MSLKKLSRRYSAQQNAQLQIILQLSQTSTNRHNTVSLLCVLMRRRNGLEMAYICSLCLRVQVGHNALEHKCTIHVLFFYLSGSSRSSKGARWGRGLGEHSPFKEGITRRTFKKEPDKSCRPTEPPSH